MFYFGVGRLGQFIFFKKKNESRVLTRCDYDFYSIILNIRENTYPFEGELGSELTICNDIYPSLLVVFRKS